MTINIQESFAAVTPHLVNVTFEPNALNNPNHPINPQGFVTDHLPGPITKSFGSGRSRTVAGSIIHRARSGSPREIEPNSLSLFFHMNRENYTAPPVTPPTTSVGRLLHTLGSMFPRDEKAFAARHITREAADAAVAFLKASGIEVLGVYTEDMDGLCEVEIKLPATSQALQVGREIALSLQPKIK